MNPQEKTHLGCLIIIFFVGIILLIHLVHQDLNLLGCGDQSSYKTVKQTWMSENLNTDHYRNGDAIPEVEDPAQWGNLKTGAWCYYDNKPENGKKYGKLYNWYAVNDPRGLAPEGWHIPTQPEFRTLLVTVNKDGNALKAIGQGSGDGAGTNTSGFSALLAGGRDDNGYFNGLGGTTYFWSSTEYMTYDACNLVLFSDGSGILRSSHDKADGFSVRCVKGVQPETQLQQQQSSSTQQPVQNNSDKTVKIGERTWMSENLNTDHYRNGDAIPEVEDPAQWGNLKTGAWCYNDNKPENGKKYGKLYNWYAVNDPRGLAPEGWHVPTQAEFKTLGAAVNNNGNALKAIGQGSGDGAGTNTSDFSALLAGNRGSDGYFGYLGYYTGFWSSTEGSTGVAYFLILTNGVCYVYLNFYDKADGFSVRCVKD
jgi:uncharacterized protein (TIGR02145 family)